MPEVTLYLGGTRSGKSAHAEAEARLAGEPVFYLATARPRPDDEEMLERIRRHKLRRPADWLTVECHRQPAACLGQKLQAVEGQRSTILFDCVTLWMTNILLSLSDPKDFVRFERTALEEVHDLTALMDRTLCHWIFVSGETGLGGIQATARERYFCDVLGTVNQLLSARADKVWFCVAGKKLLLE